MAGSGWEQKGDAEAREDEDRESAMEGDSSRKCELNKSEVDPSLI